MSGWFLAAIVAIAGLTVTALWFGVSRRRKAEERFGIQALAGMKWRECIGIVLEALSREGYEPHATHGSRGDGGSEILLTQGQDRVLLGFKSGTAYRVSETNVREFVNAVSLRGARRGILVTLGTVEDAASNTAATHEVQLQDGPALWSRLRPFVPEQVLRSVRSQAAAATRKGLWIGTTASLLAAVGVFIMMGENAPPVTQPALTARASVNAPVPAPNAMPASSTTATGTVPPPPGVTDSEAPASDQAMIKDLTATAKVLAEIAKLSPQQLSQRRAEVASQIALLPAVTSAGWSAQTTLLLNLDASDGKDAALIEEVCRIIIQHEELRYTRIQLDPPQGSGLGVRWRLCQ